MANLVKWGYLIQISFYNLGVNQNSYTYMCVWSYVVYDYLGIPKENA